MSGVSADEEFGREAAEALPKQVVIEQVRIPGAESEGEQGDNT